MCLCENDTQQTCSRISTGSGFNFSCLCRGSFAESPSNSPSPSFAPSDPLTSKSSSIHTNRICLLSVICSARCWSRSIVIVLRRTTTLRLKWVETIASYHCRLRKRRAILRSLTLVSRRLDAALLTDRVSRVGVSVVLQSFVRRPVALANLCPVSAPFFPRQPPSFKAPAAAPQLAVKLR